METLTRKEQKEKTRLGLVERAEQLFAKKGISATTTADIAKALKVSHGTVFIHFATRDDLVLAVVDRFGENLAATLQESLSDQLALKELLSAHLRVLSEFEDFYLRLISESQSLPAKVRSVLYSMNSFLSYRFYQAAQAQMKAGKIKKMEQAAFFNTWMALVHYQILNRDLFSDRTPILDETGEGLVHQFLHLIKT